MSEEHEIELWEDDAISLVESEIEEGSELAEALLRKSPRSAPSDEIPPHGPRAYKKRRPRGERPLPRPASEDEVLFDEGRDFQSLPTLKVERSSEPSRPLLSRKPVRAALALFLLLAIAGGALFLTRYLEERAQFERREEVIRARLKAQ